MYRVDANVYVRSQLSFLLHLLLFIFTEVTNNRNTLVNSTCQVNKYCYHNPYRCRIRHQYEHNKQQHQRRRFHCGGVDFTTTVGKINASTLLHHKNDNHDVGTVPSKQKFKNDFPGFCSMKKRTNSECVSRWLRNASFVKHQHCYHHTSFLQYPFKKQRRQIVHLIPNHQQQKTQKNFGKVFGEKMDVHSNNVHTTQNKWKTNDVTIYGNEKEQNIEKTNDVENNKSSNSNNKRIYDEVNVIEQTRTESENVEYVKFHKGSVVNIRYIEFYCGIGGWTMALKEAVDTIWGRDGTNTNIRYTCCASLDHSDLCMEVYRYNHHDNNETIKSNYNNIHSNNNETLANEISSTKNQQQQHCRKRKMVAERNKKQSSSPVGRTPVQIEKITVEQIIQWNASIWMMSPPCQPYTRQRKHDDVNSNNNNRHDQDDCQNNYSEINNSRIEQCKDDKEDNNFNVLQQQQATENAINTTTATTTSKIDTNDVRSKSFIHLCTLLQYHIPQQYLPDLVCLENVIGFEQSDTCLNYFLPALYERKYRIGQFLLSPVQVQIPNERPRYYCVAVRTTDTTANHSSQQHDKQQYCNDTCTNDNGNTDTNNDVLRNNEFQDRPLAKYLKLQTAKGNSFTACWSKNSKDEKRTINENTTVNNDDVYIRSIPELNVRKLPNENNSNHLCIDDMDAKQLELPTIGEYLSLHDNPNNASSSSSSTTTTITTTTERVVPSLLQIPATVLQKPSSWCMDIVNPNSHRTSCFTSSYGKYSKGTGSVLLTIVPHQSKNTSIDTATTANTCSNGVSPSSSLLVDTTEELSLEVFISNVCNLQSPEQRIYDSSWSQTILEFGGYRNQNNIRDHTRHGEDDHYHSVTKNDNSNNNNTTTETDTQQQQQQQQQRLLLRYFSGMEMAKLMGFPSTFHFPPNVLLKQQWKLVGNSLNVRVAARLIELGLRELYNSKIDQ